MIKEIKLPPGGQNTDQLMITKWHKQIGDNVKRGDILFEIETDKTTMQIESFAAGTLLKTFCEEGDYATVGDVVAIIGKPEDLQEEPQAEPQIVENKEAKQTDEFAPIMADKKKTMSIDAVGAKSGSGDRTTHKATPAAKKVLKDASISVSEAASKIDKEIIRKADALKFVGQIDAEPAAIEEKYSDSSSKENFKLIPLTSMRKTIASRMLESTTTIPSFTAEIDIDMSEAVKLRTQLNQIQSDVKISYNDILAKAVSAAIKKYELVNSSIASDGIKVFKSVSAGFAVSLSDGLVVSVVKAIEQKGIAEIAQSNRANIEQVRSGKLDKSILSGGTITISNLGMYPITRFTAIINPPEACILAIGTIRNVLSLENGEVKEKPMMTITGSFDHRVIDGAYGADFLTHLKKLMENPGLILI